MSEEVFSVVWSFVADMVRFFFTFVISKQLISTFDMIAWWILVNSYRGKKRNNHDDCSCESLDSDTAQIHVNLNNAHSSNEYSLRHAKTGVSNYTNLPAHFSDFCDFSYNNPHACCFHTCIIKEDMLESAEPDVPNEASWDSEYTQTVSHASIISFNDDTLAETNNGDMKNNPLT